MCLLTYLPTGVQPTREHLECGAVCNPHGHGFGIVIPGEEEVFTYRSMNAADVVETFMAARAEYPNGPALFHSRITTAGLTNEDNCHPFPVASDPRTVVAHNGILPNEAQPPTAKAWDPALQRIVEVDGADHRSDTRIFADEIMMRDYHALDHSKTVDRLEKWLGYNNKIVVLTTDVERYASSAYIFNEDLGIWDTDGCWYSNSSYKPRKVSKWIPYTTHWDDDEYSWEGKQGGTFRTHSSSGGWEKDDRGIWRETAPEVWEGEAESAETWPVTLGGTRTGTLVHTLVSCDVCGIDQSVVADVGLCGQCLNCNDCYEYLSDCVCLGAALPFSEAYRHLRNALEYSGDPELIIDRWLEYGNTIYDHLKVVRAMAGE